MSEWLKSFTARIMEQLPSHLASPRMLTRIGGALYLLMIVLGIIQELFIRGRIIVPRDAAATAANLMSMEPLWRSGIVIELLMVIITLVVGLILYLLLRRVNRDLALLAAFFNLTAIAVQAVYTLQLVAALLPLGNATYLKAFSPEQLYALANLSVVLHAYGFGIALFLFGPFFLMTGHLIRRSGYLPKAIGVLYQIAGVGYLANGLGLFLAPQFSGRIFIVVAGPIFVGEFSLGMWLLLKGVNTKKWEQLALPKTKDAL